MDVYKEIIRIVNQIPSWHKKKTESNNKYTIFVFFNFDCGDVD